MTKRWSIQKTADREAAVTAAIERLGVSGITALLDELLQRDAVFTAALEDILHGPVAAPGWTERRHRRLLEQIAHDALYGPDDTRHVGNWQAWEELESERRK